MASKRLAIIARNLSTSSTTNQLVKPPIQVFGIDGRYATALFSAASKQKSLPNIEKDLLKLQGELKTDVKFREFIFDPLIKRNIKSDTLKQIGAKISLNPQSTNLLVILAENGRLKNLNGVINSFKTIMAAYRGEVTCEVTTAKELDAAQKSKLEGVLKLFLEPNEKTIHLSSKVDPSIIGGMVVSIGDRYVDMSVASKIKKYTQLISTVI